MRFILALSLIGSAFATAKTCSARGGCSCDCSWAASGCSHFKDDGSCCFGCCCVPQPAPTPAPAPTPPPTPNANATLYCPGQNDWTFSSSTWDGDGYVIVGPGSVHGKASFNLLGGFVEFDMDPTNTTGEVNTNFYTTSPAKCCDYCDIQRSAPCMEMDIIENNANCAMATTWHTDADHNGGCDRGGCAGHSQLPGGAFHMRADFSMDGTMTTTLNGKEVPVGSSKAGALDKARGIVKSTMESVGAMFQSSQWQGWVPSGQGCPPKGDLSKSRFAVRNVKVMGVLLQGQEPQKC